MRVETQEKKFSPISIVLETPEEVAKFYSILNNNRISEALDITGEAEMIIKSIDMIFNEAYNLSTPWYYKLQDAIKVR